MYNSRLVSVRTTIGELVASLYDETQSFCNSNDRKFLVAYMLRELLKKPNVKFIDG